MASDIDSYGGEGRGEEEGLVVPMASDVGTAPEPKQGKRGREEEESRRLEEEKSQKLRLESEDKSGRESADPCHCDCWVRFKDEPRERRSETDLNDGLRRHQGQTFVLNASCNPNVKLLGTFRRPVAVEEIFPWDLDARENSDWYLHLVKPLDYATPIPSPLHLFSLTRRFGGFTWIYVNGDLVGQSLHRLVGRSFSLPLHPPPSLLIPSEKRRLQTEWMMVDPRMVGSCNGLYCLRDDRWNLTRKYEVFVIVWNPTTGLFRQLPLYVPSKPALDFTYDNVVYGFGYDPSSDDYKVVKIDVDVDTYAWQVEVFSLYSNSNSWRSVPGFPPAILDVQPNSSNGPVYSEGRLNWLVCCHQCSMVISFNLATERFYILPLPLPYGNSRIDLPKSLLCILDGSLSFVGLHDLSQELGLSEYRNRSRVLDIWKMRGYAEPSWTNAATIVFPHSVSLPFRILYLSKDVLILAAQRVFVFNLKENSLVCPHIGSITLEVEPYVESKVSPNSRFNITGEEGLKSLLTIMEYESDEPIEYESSEDEDESNEDESSECKSSEYESSSEDVSADTCYPRSNCKCSVVSIQKRKKADPNGRWRRRASLTFVPNDNYKSNVEILGTFPRSILFWCLAEAGLPEAGRPEVDHMPDWYLNLVTPVPSPSVTRIPSPLLSLFSLTEDIHPFPVEIDEPRIIGREDSRLRIRGRDVVGKSYYLPLHPPPSLRFRHGTHILRTEVTDGEMVGSCHGLYCLADRRGTLIDGIFVLEWSFIVWNPTAGLLNRLPSVPSPVAVFGFGYDQSTEDYKVVKIDPDTCQVQVFSLYNSESWSVQRLPQEISNIRPIFSNRGVYFAGCLNWLLDPYPRPTMIASFDLATERFRFLPLPPTYGTKSLPLPRSSLCILDGSLSFVGLHDLSAESGLSEFRRRRRVLDIWRMRGYGVESSWTSVATIVFPHLVCSPYRILYLSKDVLILAAQSVLVFNLMENSLVCPHMDGMDFRVEPYVHSRVAVTAEARRNRLNNRIRLRERAAVAEQRRRQE